jgi:hypothetical protein
MAKQTRVKKTKNGGGSKRRSTKKMTRKLKPNEAYCVHPDCRGPVVINNPVDLTKKTKNRTIKMRKGTDNKGHNVFKVVGN